MVRQLQSVRVLIDVGAECMSRSGEGLDNGFDVCNARMDQHFASCGACQALP
jgi:hypothetical protein